MLSTASRQAALRLVGSMTRGVLHAGLLDALYVFVPMAKGVENGSITSEASRSLALNHVGCETATPVLSMRAFVHAMLHVCICTCARIARLKARTCVCVCVSMWACLRA